tara:strand:- start:88 stop:252 length:165 start_codon:yes stop_codon:yes gene_type:complete
MIEIKKNKTELMPKRKPPRKPKRQRIRLTLKPPRKPLKVYENLFHQLIRNIFNI